jgi:hypothetical protein
MPDNVRVIARVQCVKQTDICISSPSSRTLRWFVADLCGSRLCFLRHQPGYKSRYVRRTAPGFEDINPPER